MTATCGEVISSWWRGEQATRVLLLSAFPAVSIYGLGDLTSGLLYEGYSFRDQAISELAAFGSPVRPLMVTAILVHNLLLVAFGLGVWRAASSRSLRWAGLALVAIGVSGVPTHTVYAMSSRWMEPGFNDTMHMGFTVLFTLFVFVVMILAAVAYGGWFRVYSIVTLAALAGFGMAASFAMRGIDQDSTPWTGGFERINAYAYFAWLVVLAVIVMRRTMGRRMNGNAEAAAEAKPREPLPA
jgi:hypothetical membrane protein